MMASQWTSFYKKDQEVSALPVLARFEPSQYKTVPMPSGDQTHVAIHGLVQDFDIDLVTGEIQVLHVLIDSLSFHGKTVGSASTVLSGNGQFCLMSHIRRF
jgi:hypothetical protein